MTPISDVSSPLSPLSPALVLTERYEPTYTARLAVSTQAPRGVRVAYRDAEGRPAGALPFGSRAAQGGAVVCGALRAQLEHAAKNIGRPNSRHCYFFFQPVEKHFKNRTKQGQEFFPTNQCPTNLFG